jgi:hypothetical protein
MVGPTAGAAGEKAREQRRFDHFKSFVRQSSSVKRCASNAIVVAMRD